MLTVTLTGIVIATMPIGEYDKRLVILTKERGKITAFAKGARKPNSAFLACSQSFSFGEFTLYEGRSSYNLLSVDISNYFEEIRKDMEAVYYGVYFCEYADYFTRENVDATEILKLLYLSLRALSINSIDKGLVRRIYELKMLTLNGWAPEVFTCVNCSTTDNISYYITDEGRVLCGECRKYASKATFISGSTIYTMQYILTSTIEKLYTFTVTKEVLKELSKFVDNYKSVYIDKKMKSLELLEKLF